MTADRSTMLRRLKARASAVRVRTTLIAVLAVGLALMLAGTAMVILLRRSLTDDVRTAARFRADAVAEIVGSGSLTETIRIGAVEDEFVQVVDGRGNIVASSENVAGAPPLARTDPDQSSRIDVPFEDEPFLAVASDVDGPYGTSYSVIAGQTLENVVESSATVINLLLIGLPLLLVVVALITWKVVGRALMPVEEIRAGADAITSERLDRRVPVPATEDEIARLATTMNAMLDRLEEGQQRQQRFISDASHELRSPVATIRQHVEVALKHPGSTAADELARTVLDENLRIQRLVEDLLMLARMDEGAVRIHEALDLDDVVFDEVRRAVDSNGKRVDTTRVSAGRVDGDEKQLRRVVGNLVDNALRHARRDIAVHLSENGNRVVLEVDDDGNGIPAAERNRVFERFVRLDEARSQDSGGAGLGLAIVAEVVRTHGGAVTVTESPLGGARVRVELPRG